MKKFIIILFVFGGMSLSTAQNINKFKYIIIPEAFEFTGEVNKYQLNSLTKFLFEKEGFNTVMNTEQKPQELNSSPCLGLMANVINRSGLFVTKLVVELKDCQGNVVFSTPEGRSREKDFRGAYHEALRDAFNAIRELDYNYSPEQLSETKKDAMPLENETGLKTVQDTDDKQGRLSKAVPEKVNRDRRENTGNKLFTHEGKKFSLNKIEEGYSLYQEGSPEPIAMLLTSKGSNGYIYNSLTKQGIAFFDSENNLIVEYFDRRANKKITLKYLLLD